MAVKKRAWDAAVADVGVIFDKDTKQSALDESENSPEDILVEQSKIQTITGMISGEVKDYTMEVSSLINSINSANTGSSDEEEDSYALLEEASKKREARIKEEKNRLRYEKEQAEKEARLFAEAEEARLAAEEAEEKKRSSITGKIASVLPKRSVSQKTEESAIESAEPSTQESPAKESLVKELPPETENVPVSYETESAHIDNKTENTDFNGNSTLSSKKDRKRNTKSKKDIDSAETDWKFLATHDEMTKLMNIRAYEEAKDKERGSSFAVVYIDINNLKYANDNFSHEVGNLLIKTVASQINEAFPDEAYRIGGDEFVAILEGINEKKIEQYLSKTEDTMHAAFAKATKSAPSGVVIEASIGWAIGKATDSFSDVATKAEERMYEKKRAYKAAHPEFDMRRQAPQSKVPLTPTKEEQPPKDYDELLTDEQRALKTRIKAKHTAPSQASTQRILGEIQSRASEIRAILIASPTFDYLFIIYNVNTFVEMMLDPSGVVDYSYLYVLYEGGPQYYGTDEYFSIVTDLFENIASGILRGRLREAKDYAKIKGINIFKNVRFG